MNGRAEGGSEGSNAPKLLYASENKLRKFVFKLLSFPNC